MKIRQYRGNQGRSPQKEDEIFKLLFFVCKLMVIPYIIYLFIKECYANG